MKNPLRILIVALSLVLLTTGQLRAQLPEGTPTPPDELPDAVQALVTSLPDGVAISRHLSVDGPDLAALLASGELVLRRELQGADDPQRFQYRLALHNATDRTIDPGAELTLQLGPGLGEYPVQGLGIAQSLYSFVEPFAWTDDGLLRFPSGGDTADWQRLDGAVAWAGLQSRYFALLLEPQAGAVEHVRYRSSGDELPGLPGRYLPSLAFMLDASPLAPGELRQWQFAVYAGPKTRDHLAAGDVTGDYRALLFPALWQWMRGLGFGLLWLLTAIHSVVPSWGLAIILLAVLVRLVMYPVARRALKSQAAFASVQKTIQPEMQRIKREYSGGEQSEMILELYKTHNVSPLAGLKPLLIVMIQIPVFVALFHVLGSAYELRDAGFLWMDTLAEPDRLFALGVDLPLLGAWFNLLPVLMAVTTLLTIKLSPAPAADASAQRRQTVIQVFMALGFLLLFYPFPAGMVLYWTMANVLHLAQQLPILSRSKSG